MKTAIESYGGVKGCYAAVYQVQPSAQTMTKHTMTGVQASNNFSYENRGLRMWRAYGIGPGKFYSADQLARFGTPQGPTRLVTMETFSNPNIEVGSYLQRTQMSEPGSSLQLSNLSQTKEESEKILLSGRRMHEGFSVVRCPPKAPWHRQTHVTAGKRIRLQRDQEEIAKLSSQSDLSSRFWTTIPCYPGGSWMGPSENAKSSCLFS